MMQDCIANVYNGMSGAVARLSLLVSGDLADRGCDESLLITSEISLPNAVQSKSIPYRVARRLDRGPGSFRDRVSVAKAELEALKPRTVYANSIASSAWALAGRQLGLRVVLHAHEFERELMYLLHTGATCIDICAAADALVVSGEAVASSLRRCLGYVPGRVIDIGIPFDDTEIHERAREEGRPRWLSDRKYQRTSRHLVGMWGTASLRNGVDLFVETARQQPEIDFLWVGAWTRDTQQVLKEAGLGTELPDNFYCTGEMDNPYPALFSCDLLAVTSREVVNLADLIELAAANKAIVCFADSIGRSASLPSNFYLVRGAAASARLSRLLKPLLSSENGSSAFPPSRRSNGLGPLIEELVR